MSQIPFLLPNSVLEAWFTPSFLSLSRSLFLSLSIYVSICLAQFFFASFRRADITKRQSTDCCLVWSDLAKEYWMPFFFLVDVIVVGVGGLIRLILLSSISLLILFRRGWTALLNITWLLPILFRLFFLPSFHSTYNRHCKVRSVQCSPFHRLLNLLWWARAPRPRFFLYQKQFPAKFFLLFSFLSFSGMLCVPRIHIA